MVKIDVFNADKIITPFPEVYQHRIQMAVRLLKNAGAKKIYLFGSLVRGEITNSTDIDIGIQGLAPEIFFRIFDQLSEAVDSPLDLVDFDEQIDFFNMLDSVGEVIQIE
ncbi:MAG: nucleotidyltransferase domain-containing protein [Bacteroidetes bacterium]|nr:nucleotidyltransferase domain-containing protein [Bacteroidota bacterium]